jgi:hypothetical protein
LFDSFGKFKMARIRQESGAEAQFKEVWAVYKRWSEEMGSSGGKRLTQTELQKRLNDEFGEPLDKKTYRRVRLFDDDEDIDAYDREAREEASVRSGGGKGAGAGAGAGAANTAAIGAGAKCILRT